MFDFLRLEMLAMFMIELVFLSLGTLPACASKTPRRVGSMAIDTVSYLHRLEKFSQGEFSIHPDFQ